jgi:hypothetical protein
MTSFWNDMKNKKALFLVLTVCFSSMETYRCGGCLEVDETQELA